MKRNSCYIILYLHFGACVAVANSNMSSELNRSSWLQKPPKAPEKELPANKFTEELVDKFLSLIDSNNIRENLKVLTAEPHLATSDRDKWLISWIERSWRKYGLEVSKPTYTFLLSFPNQTNPNKIYLLDGYNQKQWVSQHQEDVKGEDAHPNFIHAFNAYAPAGDVTGELVYVNYGRVEDIIQLEDLGVSLKGKIAISRYGKIFRGGILANCEAAGAIGVILYSDPEQVARDGLGEDGVYPNTFFLPSSGIQRGATFNGDGDPLTPSWPSIKGAFRNSVNNAPGLPGIPSQPIGWGDARELMSRLGGDTVPKEWKGHLPDITYRLGPGFNTQYQDWKVRLVVNNYREEKEDSNIIGVMRGSEEPDRYVIVGNHRDAWGYGAIDPSSGTAALLETVRVFGEMYKNGWRPRRSIVFASWCAEEYMLMGSNEFVQDNIHTLMNSAIANINLDYCTAGPILSPSASPSLKTVFVEAIRKLKHPEDQGQSIHDFLVDYREKINEPISKVEDLIKTLGSGSDHGTFSFYAGIPALFFNFNPDKVKYKGLGSLYPAYHTGFETFRLVDKIIDPGFKMQRSCAEILTHTTLNLIESTILPYNLKDVIEEIEKGIQNLDIKALQENGAGEALNLMVEQFKRFRDVANKMMRKVKKMKLKVNTMNIPESALRLRELNDQLMLLERIFILPKGLPDRPEERHILFCPSKFNKYGSSALPGIGDLLHQYQTLNATAKEERFAQIRKHISDIMITFHQAAKWLDREKSVF